MNREPAVWEAELAAYARRLSAAAQREPQKIRFPASSADELVYELIENQGALLSPKELRFLARLPKARRPASVAGALELLGREGERAKTLVCETSCRHPVLAFQLPLIAVEKIPGPAEPFPDPFAEFSAFQTSSCPEDSRPAGFTRRNHRIMDMNQQNIEAIIKQVISEMKEEPKKAAAPVASSWTAPKKTAGAHSQDQPCGDAHRFGAL